MVHCEKSILTKENIPVSNRDDSVLICPLMAILSNPAGKYVNSTVTFRISISSALQKTAACHQLDESEPKQLLCAALLTQFLAVSAYRHTKQFIFCLSNSRLTLTLDFELMNRSHVA